MSQAGLLLNRGNENGGYGYEGIAAASEGNLNDGNGYGEVGLASNGQGHGGIGIRYGGHGNGISLTEGSGLALGGKAAVDYWVFINLLQLTLFHKLTFCVLKFLICV